MAKSVEDIIVPERRRSIRDIPIPEGRRRENPFTPPTSPTKSDDPLKAAREVFNTSGERRFGSGNIPPRPPRRSRKGKWFAILIALGIIVFAVLSFLDSSTFSYVPKSQTVNFENSNFVAEKTGEGGLLFSVMKLSKEKGIDVPASGEQDVTRKASGTIVVYNNASAEPQKFRATTRFQTPAGLVYRAPADFIVPGKKSVNGVVQPGSIEITVLADVGGEEYNIGLSDFTLPGLQGTAQFSTIYARSKTPMSGGFTGKEKIVSVTDLENAKEQLSRALVNELANAAALEAPEDFVVIPSLATTTFEILPQSASSAVGSAKVNMRGNFSGVMFKKSDLARHLAKDKVTLGAGDSIDFLNWSTLNMAFAGTPPRDLASAEEINFTVSGNAKAVWQTDIVALKSDLVGKSKREIPSILNNYPSIVSATPVIRPFWKSSFPSDSSRIMVEKMPVE